ncbi:MAG: hypothetical protein Q8S84_05320 [bacterium]|nr:hypothetical protein [bacterium]MDP3380914.1 hypothetical protein [bacterium]
MFSCIYCSRALLIVFVSATTFVFDTFSSYHLFDDIHITANNTIIDIVIIISIIENHFLLFIICC